tara:strand:+ start:2464 stop:3105 length:642 start_codon:yes stop_codon:yes gene_type:complete
MSQVPPTDPNDPNQPQQPQQPQQAVPAQPAQPAAPVPAQPAQPAAPVPAQPVPAAPVPAQPVPAQPVPVPQTGSPYQGPGVAQPGHYHVPTPPVNQGRSDGALILGILSIVIGTISLLLSNIPCLDFLTGGSFTTVVLISIGLGAGGLMVGLKASGGWIVPTIGIVISALAWINQARLNDSLEGSLNESGNSTEIREAIEELEEKFKDANDPF